MAVIDLKYANRFKPPIPVVIGTDANASYPGEPVCPAENGAWTQLYANYVNYVLVGIPYKMTISGMYVGRKRDLGHASDNDFNVKLGIYSVSDYKADTLLATTGEIAVEQASGAGSQTSILAGGDFASSITINPGVYAQAILPDDNADAYICRREQSYPGYFGGVTADRTGTLLLHGSANTSPSESRTYANGLPSSATPGTDDLALLDGVPWMSFKVTKVWGV